MNPRTLFSRLAGHRRLVTTVAASGLIAAAALAVVHTADPKFFSDDPIAREPETADASGAKPWDIDLFYDLSYNLFVTPKHVPSNTRAQNLNTIDEVPDSSWFTNRVGSRALTADEIVRGPVTRVITVDDHSREDQRRRARVHRAGRERADVVRLVRCARQPPGRDRRGGSRHEDLLGTGL
jgi:hypothetical protein